MSKHNKDEVEFVVFRGKYDLATCLFPFKSWYLVGSWAGIVRPLTSHRSCTYSQLGQVAFDLLALGSVAVNVLMTPRKTNGVIIGALYRQGFYTFLVCHDHAVPFHSCQS